MSTQVNTFTEMSSIIERHSKGLISDIDLLLQLQCSDVQVNILLNAIKLPARAINKITLADLDDV